MTEPQPPSPQPPRALKPALGVLFVHGIGNQPQGETVATMGEALFKWLRSWRGRPGAPDGLPEITLGPVDLTGPRDGAPSHAFIRFGEPADPSHQEWLLAEGWWARGFHTTSFLGVLSWGLAVGPWTAIAQYVTSIERLAYTSWGSVPRLPLLAIGAFVALIKAVTLATLVAAMALALVILALVPIPGVRSVVGRARDWLVDSVGDSRQLAKSDFQYEAMAGQVRAALAWLAPKVDRVAVVAHSQGAAVAYRALTGWEDEKSIDLFVTFGSGLNKLDGLRRGDTVTFAFFGLTLVLGVLAAPFVIGTAVALVVGDPVTGGETFLAYLGGLALFVAAGAVAFSFRMARDEAAKPWDKAVPARRWRDYFASRDPVSNGPLGRNLPASVTSTEVFNADAVLLDHTGYWSNDEGFVARIALDLAAIAAADPVAVVPAEARLSEAARRRRWRFRLRRNVGWLGVMGMVLTVVGAWPLIDDLGAGITGTARHLAQQPPEPVRTATVWAADLLAIPPTLVTGAIVLAATLAAAYFVAGLPWAVWGSADGDVLWGRAEYRGGLGHVVLAVILNAVLLAVGIAFVSHGALAMPTPRPDGGYYGMGLIGVITTFFPGVLLIAVLNRIERVRDETVGAGRWGLAMLFAFPLAILGSALFTLLGWTAVLPGWGELMFTEGSVWFIGGVVVLAMTLGWFFPLLWRREVAWMLEAGNREPPTPEPPVPWELQFDNALMLIGGIGLLALSLLHPKDPLFVWVFFMGGWLLAGRALFEARRENRLDAVLSLSAGLAAAASIVIYATNWDPFG